MDDEEHLRKTSVVWNKPLCILRQSSTSGQSLVQEPVKCNSYRHLSYQMKNQDKKFAVKMLERVLRMKSSLPEFVLVIRQPFMFQGNNTQCESEHFIWLWCGSARSHTIQIIGPFFFNETLITVNIYFDLMIEYVAPQLDNLQTTLIFQPHGEFPGRWIGKAGLISWHPFARYYSPGLFSMWLY